jgi:hypothetical protein
MAAHYIDNAVFEASRIVVPLPEGWHYHDEGASRVTIFSRDDEPVTVEGRTSQILLQHETRYLIEVGKKCPEEAKREAAGKIIPIALRDFYSGDKYGRCIHLGPRDFGNGDEYHVHILYTDTGNPGFNLVTKAHEEFHAIKRIPGALQILDKKMGELHNLKVDLGRMRNEELAAFCNGACALDEHGMDSLEVVSYLEKNDPENGLIFDRALRIYYGDEGETLKSRIKAFFGGAFGG